MHISDQKPGALIDSAGEILETSNNCSVSEVVPIIKKSILSFIVLM